ncbi:hypothetical protein AOLI_G00216510 [Acnodon oligacanthus]
MSSLKPSVELLRSDVSSEYDSFQSQEWGTLFCCNNHAVLRALRAQPGHIGGVDVAVVGFGRLKSNNIPAKGFCEGEVVVLGVKLKGREFDNCDPRCDTVHSVHDGCHSG